MNTAHVGRAASLLALFLALLLSSSAFAVELVVIGDSVAYGANLESPHGRYGYVDYLYKWHPSDTTYNRAIGGTTAAQWSNQSFMNNQLAGTDPDFVVVQVGGNDLQGYVGNDGVFTWAEMVDLYHRLNAVYAAIKRARPRAKIIVVNYYDLTDQRWLPDGLLLGELSSTYVRQVSHSVPAANWVIALIAGAHGVNLVDIYPRFLHHGYGRYLGDPQAADPMFFPSLSGGLHMFDIHPGYQGHKNIAQALEPLIFN